MGNDRYLTSDEFHDGVFTACDRDESGHRDGDECDDASDAGWIDV
jgi:hypothetical protein